jgi:hypothetical protein
VCAFGFPFEQTGQGERFVDGNFDSTQPLVEVDKKSLAGTGPKVTGMVEWLRFYGGERAKELQGISGAPILDRETGWVIGVEHRYVPNLDIVYGTEIARLAKAWKNLPSYAKRLRPRSAKRVGSKKPSSNPFHWREGITDPDAFFNREREQNRIQNHLQNGGNCQIVGERRIGKTSLLRQVERMASRWNKTAVVAFLDLMDARFSTRSGWLKDVGRQFGWSPTPTNLVEFSERVDDMLKERHRPVLCMDEFEALTLEPDEFPLRFFSTLRACSGRGLSLVTTSQTWLNELTKQHPHISPLYNVLPRLSLGRFSNEDAADFVTVSRPGVPPFTPEEKEEILKFASGHPLSLQVACFHVLEAKQNGDSLAAALREAENEMRGYFRSGG